VEPANPPVSIVLPKPLTTRQQHSLDKQAARQARFDEVIALDAKGWSKSRIARTLGLDRGTVHVWLKAGRLPSWQQPSGDSTVDVYGDYLRRRWDEGCHNGSGSGGKFGSVALPAEQAPCGTGSAGCEPPPLSLLCQRWHGRPRAAGARFSWLSPIPTRSMKRSGDSSTP
jgi:hypothetical protein